MRLEDLSLIGNCQLAALVRRDGAIVWCCLPQFDSPPIFGELLDPDGGSFFIQAADKSEGKQSYRENTNIIETRFDTPEGSFRVIDFAPRFFLFERPFRPTKIIRIVEPISGCPLIRVACSPRLGWSKQPPHKELGSHHISFHGYPAELRLTTDLPLSYLEAGRPIALTGRRYFVLSWGAPVEEPLAPLCERFLAETERYWRRWVKHCEVPPLFQREVIRSALALKLHCFEDTGAIVAAITTSLPESPGSGRTWDYRYCWLRDASYALNAFRLLGHFEEREQFTDFLLNIASSSPNLNIAPLYCIDGGPAPREHTEHHWRGYQGNGPVRVGNDAVTHQQNDVFGEMVLALTPVFLDERFRSEQTDAAFDLLIRFARKAIAVAGEPDASIWELRTEWEPQTFSSVMCWAAADRAALIAARRAPLLEAEFKHAAAKIHDEIVRLAWNDSLRSFASTYKGKDLDASLLQAVMLRFLPKTDSRLHTTVEAIQRSLGESGWLLRYRTDDGFGKPAVAFIICTFWMVEALSVLNFRQEARALLQRTLEAISPTGLLAEDWDPIQKRLWGNFPQAYSHIGLIHATFAASPSWSEVL